MLAAATCLLTRPAPAAASHVAETHLASLPVEVKGVLGGFELYGVKRDLRSLCSSDLGGRRIGSPGHALARSWLGSRFEAAGLHTEFVPFTLEVDALDLDAVPFLEVAETGRWLRHRVDFAEHPRSPDVPETLTTDRWVVLETLPRDEGLSELAARAREEGAAGVLVPHRPTADGYLSKRVSARPEAGLPLISVDTALVPTLAGKRLRARIPLRRVRPRGAHVVARLPGEDRRLDREPLLVGAHYDAMGDDVSGLRFPGAGDNAAGVAIVLELARLFARASTRPSRTILFAAFDGEELDAQGTKIYAEALHESGVQPIVVNLDMAATLGEAIFVEPGGDPQLTIDALDRAGEWLEQPLVVASVSSDNRRFAQVGFPTVGIALGGGGMHTPADTVERVDPNAMAAAGRLLAAAIAQIAWSARP